MLASSCSAFVEKRSVVQVYLATVVVFGDYIEVTYSPILRDILHYLVSIDMYA